MKLKKILAIMMAAAMAAAMTACGGNSDSRITEQTAAQKRMLLPDHQRAAVRLIPLVSVSRWNMMLWIRLPRDL